MTMTIDNRRSSGVEESKDNTESNRDADDARRTEAHAFLSQSQNKIMLMMAKSWNRIHFCLCYLTSRRRRAKTQPGSSDMTLCVIAR